MTWVPPGEVTFRGERFVHRWSRDGQHEFTPPGQDDLAAWTGMVTVNEHPAVRDRAGLASLANAVLGSYQAARAVVVATDAVPRGRPDLYFACVVFGAPAFVEVAFSRFALDAGAGRVVTYSYRIHGDDVRALAEVWLDANGPAVHDALMSAEIAF